ncbi:MAG: hypothetical protein LAN18_06830 [Acidobacteriia bacterium]|nr:hypothetical protein [Terriglobia bacterium]
MKETKGSGPLAGTLVVELGTFIGRVGQALGLNFQAPFPSRFSRGG